ncbi:Dehydrogenase with unknown specificity [Congregibacter litoralis KT71]|uniref:Dehydrogenase n=1 Tax=Congregibacter litoralis KT71 TaxID=314285 RepID=A4A8M2_9GAMM|nr:SDR family oxidoreductase [Congregibacter litoralis]EAQ97414.2 Dehydrogenase with unknown specificity [Congregibacter litoralis KT71]
MKRLPDKVALVTGAARGIGLAVAQLFAKEGATVILSDINDELGEKETSQLGGDSLYRHLDVSDEQQWAHIAQELLDKFGKVDIVVNNAGITGFLEAVGPHDPENLDLASWHTVHATNLDGVALGCKYAIKMAKKSRAASIVNISSRSGIVGIPGAAAYASSKAAVRNHTKTVALYCASQAYNIRCNSIHPAAIMTPMWDAMLGEGEARAVAIRAVEADIPMKKMGDVMDVAYAALYLASDEAKYLTGIELTVDGGILAGATAAPSQ